MLADDEPCLRVEDRWKRRLSVLKPFANVAKSRNRKTGTLKRGAEMLGQGGFKKWKGFNFIYSS